MKNAVIVVAVVMAVMFAALAVNFYLKSASQRAELVSENETLKAQVEDVRAQRDQLAALEAKAEALAAQVTPAAPADAEPAPTPAPVAEPVAEPTETAEPAGKSPKNPMNEMMKMFKGDEGKKMREASARASIEMQYGALLKDLNLPADVDAQVRDMLTAHMSAEMERSMSAMEGGKMPSGTDTRSAADAARVELRNQVAQVLTTEELAQWDAYQEDLPRHMMEQSLDMQLNMFTSSMDDDTRQVIRDTLVEEMLASQEELQATETPLEIDDQFERQSVAYANAREILANTLTEEQYQQADRFLTQQEQMVAASMEMFRGMMEDDLPGSPSEPVE